MSFMNDNGFDDGVEAMKLRITELQAQLAEQKALLSVLSDDAEKSAACIEKWRTQALESERQNAELREVLLQRDSDAILFGTSLVIATVTDQGIEFKNLYGRIKIQPWNRL